MRPPSIMAGKGARVYGQAKDYPTPPGNIEYNPIKSYRSSSITPDNNYQTFSDWTLKVKSDLQSRTTTISHGEQYLPGILSGDITLNGLLSAEGSMGYYIGQFVVVLLDWSSYFSNPVGDTKSIRIPVSISDIDRTASVKDAYRVTILGKLNWIYDFSAKPEGFIIDAGKGSINPTSDYGYTPQVPAISLVNASIFPHSGSPYYI